MSFIMLITVLSIQFSPGNVVNQMKCLRQWSSRCRWIIEVQSKECHSQAPLHACGTKLNTSSLCCTFTNILSGFTLPISTWHCACHGCVPSQLFYSLQLCLFEQTNDRYLYLEPTTVFSLHLRWFYVPHFH